MIHRFLSFSEKEKLFPAGSHVLLAVSGGVDSVVMAELFHLARLDFGIAHCNFCLRGKESDSEELFVHGLAEKYAVPFYCRRFNTQPYALEHGLSVQMAARDLRYAWFESLLDEGSYGFIATAHHLDDQAETFFINLLRGTGLSGLHGIFPGKNRLIRPMLFTNRAEIEEFAQANNLLWKEDSSNKSRKYLRNRIRQEVMPSLQAIDPDFSQNLDKTIRRLRDTESIYYQKIDEGRSDLVTAKGKQVHILKTWLFEFQPIKTWLFELLKPYNFSYVVTEEITDSLNEGQGKVFFSPTHRLTIDREFLIVQPAGDIDSQNQSGIFYIDEGIASASYPLNLKFETAETENLRIPKSADIACLDYERLEFPLVMRHWRKGDWFIPFGMKGVKKLSDFFIDQKFSLPEKENTWLLCSGNNIVWIMGKRIDERYRIREKTRKAFLISLL